MEIHSVADMQESQHSQESHPGSWHSDEEASISVKREDSEMVYAYAVHKKDSAHGQRSTAEACRKTLKG